MLPQAVINFHHDAPNSQVPGFNFHELLVNNILATSHGESAWNSCLYVKTILHLQKIPRINFLKLP